MSIKSFFKQLFKKPSESVDEIIKARLLEKTAIECDCDYYEGRKPFPIGQKPPAPPNVLIRDYSNVITCVACGRIRKL